MIDIYIYILLGHKDDRYVQLIIDHVIDLQNMKWFIYDKHNQWKSPANNGNLECGCGSFISESLQFSDEKVNRP